MAKNSKTDLQRDILLTWYESPDATNVDIANANDCSSSYVSEVKNRFDDYGQMEAMMDRKDRDLEQMFGDDIFSSGGITSNDTTASQQGVGEILDDLPDDTAGDVMRVVILLVMAYVLYEVVSITVDSILLL